MYYKIIVDGEVIDVVDEHQCIRYDEKCRAVLRCRYKDSPQGFVGLSGNKLYHVEGWPEFPDEAKDRISATVPVVEIDAEEYGMLRKIIEAGQTYEEPVEEDVPEADVNTLVWAKEQKIALSKKKLAKHLEENPIVSTAHGEPGTYSVTEEKQQLMALNYSTYQIKKAAGMEAVLTWNKTGEECEEWTEEAYVQLIIEIEAYVKPLVSAQQAYEKQIQSATTLQEVDAVEISY